MKSLFDKAENLSSEPETQKVIKRTRLALIVTTLGVVALSAYGLIARGKLAALDTTTMEVVDATAEQVMAKVGEATEKAVSALN